MTIEERERIINHSFEELWNDIRLNKKGFLFPYHEAIEYQKDHPNFDPKSIAVIIPNEFIFKNRSS